MLVEASGSPAARNSQGQSPYDMSDNHLIRQYLLPLQLACEREMNPAAGSPMPPPPPTAGFMPTSSTMMNSFFPPANGSTSGIPVYSSSPSNQYPPPNQPPLAYPPSMYPSATAAPPNLPPQQPLHIPPSVPIQSQDNTSQAPPSPSLGRPNIFVNKAATLPNATSPALPESSSSSPPVLQQTTSGSDFQEMTQNPPTPPPPQWNLSTIPSAPSSSGSQSSVSNNRRIIQPGKILFLTRCPSMICG
jgi:hypothetical protein